MSQKVVFIPKVGANLNLETVSNNLRTTTYELLRGYCK